MSIADNIKALRLQHGLSQAELGSIAGVSDKAVSTWENGTKVPRMGALQKLADHFGLRKSDLIEDAPSAVTLDEFSYALHSEVQELSEENKAKLLEMARFFKQQQEREQ